METVEDFVMDVMGDICRPEPGSAWCLQHWSHTNRTNTCEKWDNAIKKTMDRDREMINFGADAIIAVYSKK